MSRKPLVLRPVRTSCVLLQVGDFHVLTDPWFADRMSGRKVIRTAAISVAELPRIDAIVASHLHTDHFELSSVREIAKANPDVAVVGTVGTRRFCRDASELRVFDVQPWEELKLGPLELMATPAEHTGPPPREVNFVLSLGGWTVFFGGDARFSQHLTEVARRSAPLDVALLPVGGTEIFGFRTTMNPDDAVRACGVLRPAFAMGIHEGGEWPAMPPMSRHPGRRAKFDELLDASGLPTRALKAGPGKMAILPGDSAESPQIRDAT